jgi:hypothetical protein
VILQEQNTRPNFVAREIAAQTLSGKITENEARLAIAGVIEGARVPQEVAAEPFGLDGRTRSELSSLLSDMMVGRVTGTGGFRKDLDMERIAGGEVSVLGWARQLLRTGVASKLRDIRKKDLDILVSPTTPAGDEEYDGIAAAYHASGAESVEGTIDSDRFHESFQSHGSYTHLRHTAQTKQDARHLRDAYEITPLIVIPADPAARARIVNALENQNTEDGGDPLLAYRSFMVWRAIVAGSNPVTDIDENLIWLWDNFTEEEADELARHRPAFTHKLALAAAMLAPKPSRDTMLSAIKLATIASPGHSWEVHAAALMNSWVARECAPFSEFSTKPLAGELVAVEKAVQDARAGASASRLSEADCEDVVSAAAAKARSDVRDAYRLELAESAAEWPELVRRTASWHNQPFGRNDQEISRRIGRIFNGIDSANFPPM